MNRILGDFGFEPLRFTSRFMCLTPLSKFPNLQESFLEKAPVATGLVDLVRCTSTLLAGLENIPPVNQPTGNLCCC